ncbi:hypothetical protein BH09PAT3_BH09PAT3_1320 [soil metagenome]
MENNPFGSKSFESSKEDTDKPTKEKTTSTGRKILRTPLEAPKTDNHIEEKASTTVESDDKAVVEKLFKALSKDETTPTLEATGLEHEGEPDVQSSEELEHNLHEVVSDHLEAMGHVDPETAEQLAPAMDFLQRVNDGTDPEAAYSAVATEMGLTEEEIAATLDNVEQQDEMLEAQTDSLDETFEVHETGIIDPSEDTEGQVDWHNHRHATPTTASTVGAAANPVATQTSVGPSSPNPAAVLPTPNRLPDAANTYYGQQRRAGELLVVGIVGYLIGRRRGRIKTEKRLLPVQKKLEKQVTHLEQDITRKEQALVIAKARLAEAPRKKPEVAKKTVRTEAIAYAPKERTQRGLQETRLGMEKPVRAEHLGHMIVAAEAPKKTVERTKMQRPNNIREAFRPEEVKTMQRNELLELSEKIVVEGANLRRIYESRLIGEKQLRHLVSEYLAGKDIRKDLRREMVEREIDFERDPILRDRVRSHLSSSNGGGGLGEILASAGIVDTKVDPELERRVKTDEQRKMAQERRVQRQRMATDTALATAVVILAVAVIILAVRS